MKDKKKILKTIGFILLTIILLGLIFFAVDYSRVKNQKTPIFCIKTDEVNDGGTTEYLGLGYKIIDYNKLNGYDKIHIGSLSMKYDDILTGELALTEEDTYRTSFTRTYLVIDQLKSVDETGEYGYLIVNQFQRNNPTVVKVKLDLLSNLKFNENYEFTFYGEYDSNKNYDTIEGIFNSFDILSIKETDKIGLDQLQENPEANNTIIVKVYKTEEYDNTLGIFLKDITNGTDIDIIMSVLKNKEAFEGTLDILPSDYHLQIINNNRAEDLWFLWIDEDSSTAMLMNSKEPSTGYKVSATDTENLKKLIGI